jgi:hypothetical protein
MSTKAVFKILLSVGLLAVILLAVQVITGETAPSASSQNAVTDERLAGSDNILLHPPVPHPANYYAGSDWIERHPAPTRPANYYSGSDWIERHPAPTPPR